MQPLYFDTAATTAVDPNVIEDMIDVLREVPGNPSRCGTRRGKIRDRPHADPDRPSVALRAQALRPERRRLSRRAGPP
jgi:hypothetical protein